LDTAILAITDVTLTLPKLILLIAVAAILRPTSFVFLAVILGLLQWSSLLRQVRSQVLSLKERDYVEAARSLDLGLFHIVFREILPTMRSYIVIHFILAMTEAMYAQVFIIFLGLVPVSGSNWGIMLYFAQGQGALFYKDSIWYILSPILAVSLVQLSLVSFAGALEDIFNPRLRGACAVPVLSVRGLSIDYLTRPGAVHAVRDVSFELEKSETLAIIGESGSGKTTLAVGLIRLSPRGTRVATGEIL